MSWTVPPGFHMFKLQPPGSQNVAVFGNGVFKGVIKLKWGCQSGTLIQHDWWLYKSRKREIMGRPAKRSGHLQAQGEGPQEKPALLAPWPWASSLQSCEKIASRRLSHACCTPLWWFWETDTGIVREYIALMKRISGIMEVKGSLFSTWHGDHAQLKFSVYYVFPFGYIFHLLRELVVDF